MKSICIVIPAYNEEKNIAPAYAEIKKVVSKLAGRYSFEIMFVNDGSKDDTIGEIEKLAQIDETVKYIDFSRNFGKEIATTAGINSCTTDACIMVDADMQHPIELIPDFIAKWESGMDVVIGVRRESKSDGLVKKVGSKMFYQIINRITEVHIVPNATDFRLIDRIVIDQFKRFTEINRMTRALIDWLGFRRDYIYFDANERLHGTASYNIWKLFQLAFNGFVSLSLVPLKIAGYLGIFITLISGFSGFYILMGKYIFRTQGEFIFSFSRTFSDAENLAILIVFLVGIILTSIGLIALYVANIHREVSGRPMYVIRRSRM